MSIKTILVTSVAPMDMHRANSGQNYLGNATAIKRRNDGRVYISGQMQRHALFSAIERLNDNPDTMVSNGDGTSFMIETDLRADMGGFMLTEIAGEPGRRTSPVSATPAVALKKSRTVSDMLLRLSTQDNQQNIATMEFSESDDMCASFSLDCTTLSTSKRYTYEAKATDKGMHVDTQVVQHVDDDERRRRARLFLNATRYVMDYSSQARNATSAEPTRVLIVLDTVHSRKAARYFRSSEAKKNNIIADLDARGAMHVIGDDENEEGERSVREAYEYALDKLDELGLAGGSETILPYAETYEALEEFHDT